MAEKKFVPDFVTGGYKNLNQVLPDPTSNVAHVADVPERTGVGRSSVLRGLDDAAKRGNEIKNGVNR